MIPLRRNESAVSSPSSSSPDGASAITNCGWESRATTTSSTIARSSTTQTPRTSKNGLRSRPALSLRPTERSQSLSFSLCLSLFRHCSFFDELRCAESVDERNNLHAPSPGAHFFRADNIVRHVVSALHNHVRLQRHHQFQRSRLIEDHHRIDCGQCGQNTRARTLVDDGAARTLERAHARVAVDGQHQPVARPPRIINQHHMAHMQQVKTAVGEHDREPFCLPRLYLLPHPI